MPSAAFELPPPASGFQFDPSDAFEDQGNNFHHVLTFFDPETKSYCVVRYDDEASQFRLMSRHRSPASYGEGEWELWERPKEIIRKDGEVETETDKTRKRDYYKRKHEKGKGDPTPAL